ncbi:hypothetical protein HYV82_00905 [Candidatus Woesearchaeota archaeon]|nr:hypothetical protein [Candidatus Woesearchaeota archaeon]
MNDETDYKATSVISIVLALFLWVPMLNIFLGALAAWLGTKAILFMRRNKLGYRNRYFAFAALGAALGIITVTATIAFYFLRLKI